MWLLTGQVHAREQTWRGPNLAHFTAHDGARVIHILAGQTVDTSPPKNEPKKTAKSWATGLTGRSPIDTQQILCPPNVAHICDIWTTVLVYPVVHIQSSPEPGTLISPWSLCESLRVWTQAFLHCSRNLTLRWLNRPPSCSPHRRCSLPDPLKQQENTTHVSMSHCLEMISDRNLFPHLDRPQPGSERRSSPCTDCGRSRRRCGCRSPGRLLPAPPRQWRLRGARDRLRASSGRYQLRSSYESPGRTNIRNTAVITFTSHNGSSGVGFWEALGWLSVSL